MGRLPRVCVRSVIGLYFCASLAAGATPVPPQGCRDNPECTVVAATSVMVYRIQDLRLLLARKLPELDTTVAARDRKTLDAEAAKAVVAFVLDERSYRKPDYIAACAFTPDYVFEFRAPELPPVWWLAGTNCEAAALVDAHMSRTDWSVRVRYLSQDAVAALSKCTDEQAGKSNQELRWPAGCLLK